MAQVQFPWRYLCPAIIFMSLLYGFLIKDADKRIYDITGIKIQHLDVISVVVCVLSVCFLTGNLADNAPIENPIDSAEVFSYNVGGGEYLPADTYVFDDKFNGQFYPENLLINEILHRDGTNISMKVTTGDIDGCVEVPLINYKYYRATDGVNDFVITDGTNNLLKVNVNANYEGIINISYEPPIYWSIALYVSIIGLLAFVYISVKSFAKI